MIELILIRHGETDWNVQNKMQGIMDIPINDNGKLQATSLSLTLLDDSYSHIISSPLKRAYKTAEILNKDMNLDLFIDSRLSERDYGSLTGQNIDYISSIDITDEYCAESYDQFQYRCKEFLESFKDMAHGKILVVTHGAIIKELLTIFNYSIDDPKSCSIKNCSIHKLFV